MIDPVLFIEFDKSEGTRRRKINCRKMRDSNDLMEFLSASLGATLDEIYQRLIDCDFAQEDPGLAMFVVSLLNALGREGRGTRPTEIVLMLAFGESGTAERGRNRLMRWRRGEMSGHDLAREPGLGEQRDHRLGEMPLYSRSSEQRDSPTAAPPLKRVRMNEIEIQTSETIETLEKKEKDQSDLCAKLQEYRALARERDEWKKKFEDLQIAFKEEEIKHLKELYMARVSQVSPEVLARMNSSDASRDARPRTKAEELCAPRARGSSADITVCSEPEKYETGSFRHLSGSPVSVVIQPGGQSNDERDQQDHWPDAGFFLSQRLDRSPSSSERTPRTIASTGTAHGGLVQKSRVVDIRKNLMVRNQFVHVAAEHPRACLNGIGWNSAISNQAAPQGIVIWF